ncbi:SCP-2 sterol transfer family protein [Marininema mesophilum]|uniref:SCP-2 sterol transfer family protein n=1 Tax=Marininema mesophilum TaxID=1048340 RepID=A0A1H2YE20_9BACL|nr:SCP2 sterol-binding domain-containing protein [Marininema mesophilum]SDX03417.1 SCP-2 sterol transfer family protein [Marininema mesophilum]
MTEMTTSRVFQVIKEKLQEDPKPIEGMETTYRFKLSGDDGGIYELHLNKGTAEVKEGEHGDAHCTIEMSDKNFKEMLLGNLNTTAAFMTGKLKVKGDMSKAMKLQTVLGKYDASSF